MPRYVRPVVRQFSPRHEREAAAHVRAGGHAIVWDSPESARLVVARPRRGDDMDLGVWSMLDIERLRYAIARRGPLAGLAFTRVPQDCLDIVRTRAQRDSIHPGATRTMHLDCSACAACCRDNEVVLWPRDVKRLARAGRPELARRPYARRTSDGRIVLTLRRDKRCRHLQKDNRCAIYPIRPEACSQFPPASECCLSSREDELGIVDGDSQ
jgi:hypothetical protein